jgi:molecular chaperone GrpE (heat shock protein)
MRVERDKIDMMQYLSAKMILPLLAQMDNLERAVKLKEGITGDSFVDGIRSMLQSFEKYLESQ